RDLLAVVVHDVVLQERERTSRGRLDRRLATLWQLRRVEVRDYEQHAWRLLRPARIERDDGAFGDRALHDHGVRETRQLKLCRVARLAGDLERPVGPIDGLGDDAHAMPPAVCTARTMARCASSTLNAMSRYGRAPSTAAAAAWRSTSAFSGCPARSASLCVARQGLCATPPSARRAARIVLPCL